MLTTLRSSEKKRSLSPISKGDFHFGAINPSRLYYILNDAYAPMVQSGHISMSSHLENFVVFEEMARESANFRTEQGDRVDLLAELAIRFEEHSIVADAYAAMPPKLSEIGSISQNVIYYAASNSRSPFHGLYWTCGQNGTILGESQREGRTSTPDSTADGHPKATVAYNEYAQDAHAAPMYYMQLQTAVDMEHTRGADGVEPEDQNAQETAAAEESRRYKRTAPCYEHCH